MQTGQNLRHIHLSRVLGKSGFNLTLIALNTESLYLSLCYQYDTWDDEREKGVFLGVQDK